MTARGVALGVLAVVVIVLIVAAVVQWQGAKDECELSGPSRVYVQGADGQYVCVEAVQP